MRTKADNSHMMNGYIWSIFKQQGKDLNKCEQCGVKVIGRRRQLHHTKYDGATINDIQIVCSKCNMKLENKGLV